MPDEVRFKGHISVILVMDMKPFVHPYDQQRFETIRGDASFAKVLKEKWPTQLQGSAFEPVDPDVLGRARSPEMSTDEVGFVTGMFRSNILDLYSAPLYRVKKESIPFSKAITENVQYKNSFAQIWEHWNIYLRPTMTGMMIVRLERPYPAVKIEPNNPAKKDRSAKFVSILTAASHVIELQTPFDVPKTIEVVKKLQAKLAETRADARERRNTEDKLKDTLEFLKWLGVSDIHAPELDYIPVHWQLANELSSNLIGRVDHKIEFEKSQPIHFDKKRPDLSKSVYNVYTIYHVDDLVVNPLMIAPANPQDNEDETEPTAAAPVGTVTTETSEVRIRTAQIAKALKTVEPIEIKRSIQIKRELVGLVEGAILSRKPSHDDRHARTVSSASPERHFPRHNLKLVKRIFDQDIATWEDELCILTPRTAIIMPSRRARSEQLWVSTLEKTTRVSVDYTRYWEALERLIEFVNEIGILAQLVETDSAGTLRQFVQALDETRRDILQGELNGSLIDSQRKFNELTNQSANLSRLVGLCQGLTNPNSWSRAEYAIDKASHLIQVMQTSLLVNHAERNVSNLTNLVDHVDELVVAQLSESSNAQNSRQSLILAGLSLSIILFTLPSFWADIDSLNDNPVVQLIRGSELLNGLALAGSILAPFFLLLSVVIALMAGVPMIFRFSRKMQSRRNHHKDDFFDEAILEEAIVERRRWLRIRRRK